MTINELTEIINAIIHRLEGQGSGSVEPTPWTGCIFGDCTDEPVPHYGIRDPNRKTP